MKIKILLIISLCILSLIPTQGQVKWDIRGGVSYGTLDYGEGFKEHAFSYLGELGIDIPLKSRFALEIAVRYKNLLHVDSYESMNPSTPSDYYKNYWINGDGDGRANLLEFPVKFGYKIPIFSNTAIRVAAGPYVTCGMDETFRYYQSGISTAVTYEYKAINLGLNYNIAIHNAFERYGHNGIFLTVGFKFGSSAWKSIGKAAMAIGSTAAVVGAAFAETSTDSDIETYDENGYESNYTESNMDTNTRNTSKSSQGAHTKELEKQNQYLHGDYRTDSRTYTGYEDQLRDMKLNRCEHFSHLKSEQYRQRVKDIQNKMKKLREKIVSKGGTRSKSSFEDWDPTPESKDCP